VTEKNLHDPEIDTAFNEPRGVAVAQATERDAGDASLACGDRDSPTECPASDRSVAGLVGKKPPGVLVGLPEFAQAIQDWVGQRDDALLVALADDPQVTIDAVNGPDLECSSFTGTQAAGVDEDATAFVNRVLQARKEIADLGIAERIGEPLLLGLPDLFFENSAQSRLSVLRYRYWMP
jgi:hypothetical protein